MYLADGSLRGDRVVGFTMMATRKRELALPRLVSIANRIGLGYRDDGTSLLVYSSVLNEWMHRNLGKTKSKRVPEWWNRATPEFLTGLVEGWIHGDGELPKRASQKRQKKWIVGYGKNLTLLMGIKELSVSLGFGIPTLRIRKPKHRSIIISGKRCRVNGPMYRLVWGGDSFYALADEVGFVYYPRSSQ